MEGWRDCANRKIKLKIAGKRRHQAKLSRCSISCAARRGGGTVLTPLRILHVARPSDAKYGRSSVSVSTFSSFYCCYHLMFSEGKVNWLFFIHFLNSTKTVMRQRITQSSAVGSVYHVFVSSRIDTYSLNSPCKWSVGWDRQLDGRTH